MDAKAARKEVGDEVQTLVLADEHAKGGLTTFYEEIDTRWAGRDAHVVEAPWEGAPSFNLQTMRNKVDQAVAFTVLPHAKSHPHFLFREGASAEGSNTEAVERTVQFFLHQAKYVLKLAQAVSFVFRRGSCPMKVEYVKSDDAKKPGIKLTPLDLQWFRHYPNTAETFEDAVLVGDVIQVTVDYIERRQRAGEYFSDKRIGAAQTRVLANADPGGDKQSTASNASYAKDDAVDLFCGMLYREWGEESEPSWHYVVVAIDEGILLYESPWESQAFPYSDLFVHKEPGRNYNESCMGGLMLDPHDWVNYTSDSIGWLQTYATMPAVVAMGATPGEDVLEMRPGLIIPMEDGTQLFKASGDTNLAGLPMQVQLGRQVADETSRVSQNGLGSNLKSDTTAYEASQVAAGQATGIEAYQFLGLCFGMVELVQNILWLLAENFDDWYPVYEDVLPVTEQADFEKEYYIEINGQTPANTPAATAAQATQLMQAWASVVQAQPDLPGKYPEFIPELLRALVEATTLPNKSKILPSRDAQKRRELELQEARNALIQNLDQIAAQAGAAPGGGIMGATDAINGGTPPGVSGVNAIIPGAAAAVEESQAQ